MRAKLYSTRPLEDRELQLCGNPSDNAEAREQLRKLGVFHFRAEITNEGVVIPPEGDNVLESSIDESGYVAYRSQADFDDVTLAVKSWPIPNSREGKQKLKKLQDKYGDSRQWLNWNEPVTIMKLTDNLVVTG